MLSFLIWYLILALFGLAALPLGWTWFRHLPDRGWGLLRPLGLLLVGFAVWFLGSFGLLRLNVGSGLAALVALAALGSWVLVRWGGGWPALRDWLRAQRWLVFVEEALFLFALAFWTWYRIHDVEGIQYTERPMDFALFNAILRGGEMPPNDPWLSGFAISYYYLGYLIMAQVTALSGAVTGVAYNLAVATLAALTSGGVFSLAYNLVLGEVHGHRRQVAAGLGLLAVLLVLGISNVTGIFNTAFYRGVWPDSWFPPLQVHDLAFDANGARIRPVWWWWASSRTLSDYAPDGSRIEIIDEFPFFSFMLGDMHPHVLALPFSLVGLTLAFNALRGALAHPRVARWQGVQLPPEAWGADEGFGKLLFALTAIVIGGMGMLNTWDFPTQATILSAVWLVAALPAQRHERTRVALGGWASSVALLLLGAGLLYLPFYVSFRSQAQGIRLVQWSTQPQHFALMFGLFLLVLVPFLLAQARRTLAELRGLGRRTLALAALMVAVDAALLLLLTRLALPEERLGWLLAAFWLLVPLAFALLLPDEDPSPLAIVQGALVPLLVGLATQRWTLALLAALLALALTALWARVRALLPVDEPIEARASGVPARPIIAGGSQLAVPTDVALAGTLGEEERPALLPRASLLFALLLAAVALLLTMGSELFYIKDGFGGRMNTVFKLYYQAWTLFALASTFALVWLARRLPLALRLPWLVLFAGLTLASLWYPVAALTSKANFRQAANWDGRFWMAQHDPDRFAAIQWLDALPGQAVIVEKAGGAYNPLESALSGWTGHSTLLGWENHEGQWRGTYDELGRRRPIIEQIYTSTDAEATRALLDEWNVDYVALTPQEIAAYNLTGRQIEKFRDFMVPVFEQGSVVIFGR